MQNFHFISHCKRTGIYGLVMSGFLRKYLDILEPYGYSEKFCEIAVGNAEACLPYSHGDD